MDDKIFEKAELLTNTGEICPMKIANDLVSGKWKILILWYLRERPRRFGDEFYADFGEEFKGDDFFSLNCNLLTFSDGLKNEYILEPIGYINPSNDDYDTISINLYRGDKLIESGSINILWIYGIDENGNVGNGAGEDITVNINNVISKLIDIKKNIIKDLHWRIDKLQNLIQALS